MPTLVSLDQLSAKQIWAIAERSIELYVDRDRHDLPLQGRVVASLFEMTSTRTRVAFSAAAARLGASVVSFGPMDLQLNTGETLADTGRILSSMVDVVVARIRGRNRDLDELSYNGRLPVVNAMSADEHPTQGLTDLATMKLHLGDLAGLRVLYVGEGNNTAIALAKVLCHVTGCRATFLTPNGYQLSQELITRCNSVASEHGGGVAQVDNLESAPVDTDVVYTTRWQTTGTTKQDGAWREAFRPLYIDEGLMRRWPSAVLMHDLPAHRGEEIAASVLEGERSIAWEQAAMKMATAMAVLEYSAAQQQSSTAVLAGEVTERLEALPT